MLWHASMWLKNAPQVDMTTLCICAQVVVQACAHLPGHILGIIVGAIQLWTMTA